MAWSGSNNIADGVTIDLGLMNEVTYDSRAQIAHLLPGGTWAGVYTALEKRTEIQSVLVTEKIGLT